jgi:hypothetical protein
MVAVSLTLMATMSVSVLILGMPLFDSATCPISEALLSAVGEVLPTGSALRIITPNDAALKEQRIAVASRTLTEASGSLSGDVAVGLAFLPTNASSTPSGNVHHHDSRDDIGKCSSTYGYIVVSKPLRVPVAASTDQARPLPVSPPEARMLMVSVDSPGACLDERGRLRSAALIQQIRSYVQSLVDDASSDCVPL